MVKKLSRELLSRLEKAGPKDLLPAILVLRIEKPKRPGRRQSASDREAAVLRVLAQAKPIVQEIDDILGRFEGRRTDASVSALGTVAIQATPDAVRALAESEHIEAVLDDQTRLEIRAR